MSKIWKKSTLSTEHPLYTIWCSMKQRCINLNHQNYKNYGGRGIYVCDEWINDFKRFAEWADDKYEPGLSLDRINNDGPYGPDNCRFITYAEQNINRRNTLFVTAFNEDKTIPEWLMDPRCGGGLHYSIIWRRLSMGWEPKRAISQPYSQVKTFYNGKGLVEWSKDSVCKVSYQVLAARMRNDWDLDDALRITVEGGIKGRGNFLPAEERSNVRYFTAYNETKILLAWVADPRCLVDEVVLNKRVYLGWDFEKALSTPVNLNKSRKEGLSLQEIILQTMQDGPANLDTLQEAVSQMDYRSSGDQRKALRSTVGKLVKLGKVKSLSRGVYCLINYKLKENI